MKSTLMLMTLAAAVAGYYCAVVEPRDLRANLNVGSVGYYDKLLSSVYMYLPAASVVQAQDFIYRGNITTYITAVQATEHGAKQKATAKITSGGLGKNNVTIRFQTVKNYGFNYLVRVWGQ